MLINPPIDSICPEASTHYQLRRWLKTLHNWGGTLDGKHWLLVPNWADPCQTMILLEYVHERFGEPVQLEDLKQVLSFTGGL